MSGNMIATIEDRILLRLAAIRKNTLYHSDPIRSQETVLIRLLKANRDTVFGREFDFASIGSSRRFLERVPSGSYGTLIPWIDRMLDNEKDILFSGRPVCFGATSGTDGVSKRIPYNPRTLTMTRLSAVDASLLAGLQHGSMLWYRSPALYIGPRKADQQGKWKVYSEGTAFLYHQAPFLRRQLVQRYSDLPGRDEPLDYDRIEDLIRSNRIQFIAGNPLEIVSFLRATEMVLPEVRMVSNCGFWMPEHERIYRTAFPNATLVDLYGSNEGILGLPISSGKYLLNHRRIFYSFNPLGGPGQSIGLEDATPGQHYLMNITTPGGLWNYCTGDAVCLESIRPPVILLCGRGARAVPVEDGWLTEHDIVQAVQQSYPGMRQYYLRPGVSGCILCVAQDGIDNESIDQNLCRINLAYARARKSGKLGPLILRQEKIRNPDGAKPARIRTVSE